MKKVINIEYEEYTSLSEMPEKDAELVRKAVEATRGSYAKYSNFRVGAALRLSDGRIVTGANQENVAYPSGLCAERTAIFYAQAQYPDLPIEAVAIAAADRVGYVENPIFPCGACRQVFSEIRSRYGKPIRVIMYGLSKIYVVEDISALLPFQFEFQR